MCSGGPTHADRSVDRTARRSGLRSVAVAASAVSPRRLTKTGKAADPGQGVDERAAPDAKDAANRGLHGAAVDAELDTLSLQDFRGPAPERSQFVRLCYKDGPFVSSGLAVTCGRSRIRLPACRRQRCASGWCATAAR